MIRPGALLKRSLIFLHRWLGVALSVLFFLWFVSGIVMMYWGMPGVTARDRRERMPVLDPSRIQVTPERAYAALNREQPPGGVTLTSFDGRPVYRFGGGGRGGAKGRGGGGRSMVFADDGTVPPPVDDALIDRVATGWARQPLSEAVKESITEPDQWTLEGGMRTLRPLYKFSFRDGQQVYINGRTAEVMQYTTSESRFWAYLGAIPHWLYFTPLRVHQPQWFQLVVWSSAIGTGAAILGAIVAVWMLSPAKRYRHAGRPTMVPYRGWKRWHTILGLFFGVVTATWAFSGMLSMGPFDFIQRITGTAPSRAQGGPRPFDIANVLRGQGRFDIRAYGAKPPAAAIASIWADFKPKEIEFTMFDGRSIYIATDTQGNTRIVPVDGPPKESFDAAAIMKALRDAGGDFAELRMMNEYDAYYLDRRGERPLPVIYARLNDEGNTRYYIDPVTGRVVGNYNSRGWVSRWLYHGLHSLDFPLLYKYRPLWDIVVIGLMLGGTALCVTSLVLTWRVLQKKLAHALRARFQPPNEDLTPI